jgi:hypothetical protein
MRKSIVMSTFHAGLIISSTKITKDAMHNLSEDLTPDRRTHLHIQDDPQPFYDSIEQQEELASDAGSVYTQFLYSNKYNITKDRYHNCE